MSTNPKTPKPLPDSEENAQQDTTRPPSMKPPLDHGMNEATPVTNQQANDVIVEEEVTDSKQAKEEKEPEREKLPDIQRKQIHGENAEEGKVTNIGINDPAQGIPEV